MKLKNHLLASAALLVGVNVQAQNQGHVGHDHHPGEPCISHHVLHEQLQDPEVRASYEAYQEALVRYVNDPDTPKEREGNKYIIPVVVHILQMGGSENISDQKVYDQIEVLNEDFQRINADTVNTPERFRDIAGRMDVEFRLATKDPLGNCTNGIVRVFTDNTEGVRDPTGFKSLSYWNAYSYLNIWVVNSIGSIGSLGTVLGYAQFPATGLLSTDGITVIAQQFGGGGGGRTATHEVGHWLNLIHIWGDSQCGSDGVADTPIAQDPNFSVCGNVGQNFHTEPYNLGVCDPENPHGEMFSNYMDYSPGNCQNVFSAGQVERMQFVFDGTGETPGIRGFMITDENLEMTGTADPYDYENHDCVPRALFHVNQSSFFSPIAMICEGDDVSFRANAFNGSVDAYAWQFPGGEPGTATTTNPTVSYGAAGSYDVTMQATNSLGDDSQTVENMVVVSSNTAQYQSDWGYFDSFWDEETFNNDYIILNHDNTFNKWEFYSSEFGGSTGNESVRMANFDNVEGRLDEFITPSMDLSTVSNPVLKFRWTGAARNNSPSDQLRILFSTNCGKTWTQRTTLSEFDLVNSGVYSNSYVPNAASIWSEVEVTPPPAAANSSNVRVKFQWTSGGGGNNFYIDDITFSGAPLSAQALEREIDLNIVPNPTSDATTVSMMLENGGKVEMTMIDMMGRKVMDVHTGELSSGAHRFDVDLASQPAGIYFLRLMVNNHLTVKKVVRN